MRDETALLVTFCAALLAAGCRAPGATRACDPSAAAVSAAAQDLIARDNAGDLDGVLARYTADVAWYPPLGAPLRGKAAIRPRYEQIFSTFSVALTSDVLEAASQGDSGFAIGTTRGTLTPRAGGAPVTVDDRFVALVRCVDGDWRVSHLIWGPRGAGAHRHPVDA
jgi:uncharacterized protein (TIGR02246 family)